MKISNIESTVTRLPLLDGEWGDQIHRVTHIELVVVNVETDSGVVGTGISHTSGVGGRTIATLIEELCPEVLGREINPRALWQSSWRFLHDCGGGGVTTLALAALDLAYWDVMGKHYGVPVADLIGRVRDRVPLYGSAINLNKTAEEVVEQVRNWSAAGYHAVKVKVGKSDIEEDVERLAKIREVAPHMPLMVDANQGWSLPQAVSSIKRFEPFDLVWVEEPLLVDDIDAYAQLARRVRTPIGLGENVYTVYQFQALFNRKAVDYVQADVVRVGGITPYLEIASLARAQQLPMAPHFIMEISAQVVCAVDNLYLVEDTLGGTLTELGAVIDRHVVVDGSYVLSDRPGLGVEWNWDYLLQHRLPLGEVS